MAKRMKRTVRILCLLLAMSCLGGCDSRPAEETESAEKEYYVFDPAVTWELRPLVTGDGEPLWYTGNKTEYAPVDYAVTEEGVTWLYQELLYDETGAVTGFVTHTKTFGWERPVFRPVGGQHGNCLSVCPAGTAGGCRRNPEGAAAFLSFLLSETVQCATMIQDTSVPVTWEGVEAALAYNWWYCSLAESISGGDTLTTWDKTMEQRKLEPYEKHWQEIRITDEMRTRIRQMLDDAATARYADPAVEEMIFEELQAYLAGDRSAEETAKVLQSRVGTYLAENTK